MKEPQDIEVEVELMAIDGEVCNPLEEPLPPKEASLYRAIVARINFLAADRAAICIERMQS